MYAQPGKVGTQLCLVVSDSYVAQKGKAEPAANGVAVDGGDDRNF